MNHIINFFASAIVFMAVASVFLYLLKSFFQKIGRTVGKTIFNGHEQYALIIINDNDNSMENVVNTMMLIGISKKIAIELMIRIHEEGIAVIWAGARDEALQHSQTLQQNGLRCFMTAIQ